MRFQASRQRLTVAVRIDLRGARGHHKLIPPRTRLRTKRANRVVDLGTGL